MQKFLRILVIILLFMMCLLIGAKLADISISGNTNIATNFESEENQQIKLLVFVVDDLTKKNPGLLSVWSVVIYYQDANGIMFIPLTEINNEDFKEYRRSFLITSDKDLQEKTQKFFNTKFKTRWDANIILDTNAVNRLIDWLSYGSIQNSEIPISNKELIDGVCSSITQNELRSLDTIEWSSIIPDHFKTDLPSDYLMNMWKTIEGSNELLCEMIEK